jgi:hypothetical protein
MQQWPLPKTFAKVETVRVPPSFCAETLLQKSFGAATEFLKSFFWIPEGSNLTVVM